VGVAKLWRSRFGSDASACSTSHYSAISDELLPADKECGFIKAGEERSKLLGSRSRAAMCQQQTVLISNCV
jgi:hypothetical protein